MTENPLRKHFRQPHSYLRLPSLGKWYSPNDIEMISGEIPIYSLTALDEIWLNTADAMLNGQSLEKVIKSCAPTIKNVKNIVLPDLESIFIAIKQATLDGKEYDIDRKCPSCNHENTFGINCQDIIARQSYVEDSDTITHLEGLEIHVKPYIFELRRIFVHNEIEEQRLLNNIDSSPEDIGSIEKAKMIAESVERLAMTTFDLVARSITKVVILDDGEPVEVTDTNHINEWLQDIENDEAGTIIDAVTTLNKIGVDKSIGLICEACQHQWNETLELDPTSFFTKR
jgi:hypothetical protein